MSEIATFLSEDFSAEQKEYLSGFTAGAGLTRNLRGLPSFADANSFVGTAPASIEIEGPDKLALEAAAAQEKTGKLVPEEKAKRELHPFDRWDQIVANTPNPTNFPKAPTC